MVVPVLHEELRGLLLEQKDRSLAWGRTQDPAQLDPPLFPPVSVEPTLPATGETISSPTIRRGVQRVCRAMGLPSITTHSLRGMFATYAVEVGETIEAVGRTLGQRGTATAERHYVNDQAKATARVHGSLRAINGGKK